MSVSTAWLTSLPMTAARKIGATGHASLLQMPMMLMRRAALSMGPRMVM